MKHAREDYNVIQDITAARKLAELILDMDMVTDCFIQAGYCLDAPNLIPAGSVFADSICEEFPHEPMETTIERGMT